LKETSAVIVGQTQKSPIVTLLLRRIRKLRVRELVQEQVDQESSGLPQSGDFETAKFQCSKNIVLHGVSYFLGQKYGVPVWLFRTVFPDRHGFVSGTPCCSHQSFPLGTM